jgi:hypothetical protein
LRFIIANIVLLSFGLWCWFWPVRSRWSSATLFASIWIGIEMINGIGHPLWTLRQGSCTPGAATAPVLLVLAILLAREVHAIKSQ